MDMEIIDTVTADCLEVGDVIRLEDGFCEVRAFNDHGSFIEVTVREIGYDDDDHAEFNPSQRISVYGYSVVEV